ncbi:hypothetical protein DKX38_006168 [Salix brachista]|uniref:RING-type E3 ubiquitin transferase n=1 Tax=Salix brachista TaxID=2182728 RepID=A0A5N5N421_9ROSI|nr:hypothetical protein DKX38_006168 [Salix brachista]
MATMSSGNPNMMQDPESNSHQQPQILPGNIRQIFQHALNDVFAIRAAFRNTNPDGNHNTAPGRLPASKDAIDAMPRITVQESGNDCAICFNDIGIGSELGEMPCKHGFHSGCIEQWLRIHGSCPVCRFAMPVEGGEVGASGSES